jgi:hypothetical protein
MTPPAAPVDEPESCTARDGRPHGGPILWAPPAPTGEPPVRLCVAHLIRAMQERDRVAVRR